MEQAESRSGGAATGPTTGGPHGSVIELRARVGSTVVSHHGVFRIEPTLRGSWSGVREPGTTLLDGIVLEVHDRLVDLEVNISTRAEHQAHRTVSELRVRLGELVDELGFVCSALTINVLSIEPAA